MKFLIALVLIFGCTNALFAGVPEDGAISIHEISLGSCRYRESWVARACRFPLAWLRVKMSLGPTPRCSDLYVVADVDALLGHWPITFSCLIQRGAFFFALMAS